MVTFMYCLGIIAEYNILISHIYNFIFIWSQPPRYQMKESCINFK